jgi:hypothetical protein
MHAVPIKGFNMVPTEHIDNMCVGGRLLYLPLAHDLSQRRLSVALQGQPAPLRHDVYPSDEPLRVHPITLGAQEPGGLNVRDQQVEGIVDSAIPRLK